MLKTAIVTDSNSGIFQKEAAMLGDVYVIPMPFTIDEQTYFEDVNLTIPEFYQKMHFTILLIVQYMMKNLISMHFYRQQVLVNKTVFSFLVNFLYLKTHYDKNAGYNIFYT